MCVKTFGIRWLKVVVIAVITEIHYDKRGVIGDMALKQSKKPAIFLTIIIFLMVGGATAFIYVINNTTSPVIEADIDAHFAALEIVDPGDEEIVELADSREMYGTDIVLYSSGIDTPGVYGTKKNVKSKKRNKRPWKSGGKSTPTAKTSQTGITQIADGTWLIAEDTYRHAQKNPMQYIGSARAELATDDNGPVGFRLKNIKKNSCLRDIGLRNNDVLIAINGHSLNSVENVTLAIASFQKATRFRLDLLRKKQKQLFYYKIIKE